ncbi:hypothetical protein [Profundibacter sp.]|uniref:hypothetical protein n=1 Tax=Profundibacter sp. TaxID=3101071 RepID=UPI003D136E2D
MNKILYISGSTAFFAWVFYAGLQVHSGDSLGWGRGILRIIVSFIDFLSTQFGYENTGFLIMGLAVFGGIFAAISIWRSPFF